MRNLMTVLGSIDWKNIPAATYTRYILMLLAGVNMILTHFGLNPIPISDDSIYQVVTDVLAFAVMLTNTWCNNSVTAPALKADEYYRDLVSETTDDSKAG